MSTPCPRLRAAAVDLGATSGRVVVGELTPNGVEQQVAARVPTRTERDADGRLRWWTAALFDAVVDALDRQDGLGTVGVDSWAVDYGLLAGGRLVAAPRCYRDERHDREFEILFASPHRRREVFGRSGVALQPFNTLVQARTDDALPAADRLLLVPDLLNRRLCGVESTELTNASTTQLLDVATRTWAPDLLALAGIRPDQLTTLHAPGTRLGTAALGSSTVEVVAVGSHDTASAVAGTPLASPDEAYVSCGTWALVGVEEERPIVDEHARRAGLTNELGLGGRVRLLRNVTGLWLVERCLAAWRRAGLDLTVATLAAQAATVTTAAVVDPDDPRLRGAADVPVAVAQLCAEQGLMPPRTPAETMRCLLQSMVRAWRSALTDIDAVRHRSTRAVRLVGGGAAIALLAQLAADELGLPVHAGPVEATAAGNLLSQGITAGVYRDLDAARAALRSSVTTQTYRPSRGSGSR